MSISWGNNVSFLFDVSNGVKQGGVLLPILFNIYMDCLIDKLKNSGVGCHIGNKFMGAYAYADDLVLLAPTKQGMKILLNLWEQFVIQP